MTVLELLEEIEDIVDTAPGLPLTGKIMVDADMAKVAVERAGDEIRTNLAEYLEKGIVK